MSQEDNIFDKSVNDTPRGVDLRTLYAGGKIEVIQKLHIIPDYRFSGADSMRVDQVRTWGLRSDWTCIELCTPPFPEFGRTSNFCESNALAPAGGRTIREIHKKTAKSGFIGEDVNLSPYKNLIKQKSDNYLRG